MGKGKVVGFVTLKKRHSKGSRKGKRKRAPITQRVSRRQAFSIHASRSRRAQKTDEALKAKLALSPSHWAIKPSRLDLTGVDFPQEWRSEYEVKRAKQVREDLAKYETKLEEAKKRGDPKEIANVADLVEMLKRSNRNYEWQRKHPFLEAGYDGQGIKNYESALQQKRDYGFNLRKPQSSFIQTYHLKPRDIKGLRIYLEPHKQFDLPGEEKGKEHGLRTRAYYRNGVLHLPPVGKEKPEKTRHTIQHEVGHHVYHRYEALRNGWERTFSPLKVKKLERDSKYRLTGKTLEVKRYPSVVAINATDYFRFAGPLDLFEWEFHSLVRGKEKDYTILSKEAWAQSFAGYRSGEIKRTMKRAKKDRELALEHLNKAREKMAKAKREGEYKTYRRDYLRKKKWLKDAETSFNISDAIYTNWLTFYGWLNKADSKGWYARKR